MDMHYMEASGILHHLVMPRLHALQDSTNFALAVAGAHETREARNRSYRDLVESAWFGKLPHASIAWDAELAEKLIPRMNDPSASSPPCPSRDEARRCASLAAHRRNARYLQWCAQHAIHAVLPTSFPCPPCVAADVAHVRDVVSRLPAEADEADVHYCIGQLLSCALMLAHTAAQETALDVYEGFAELSRLRDALLAHVDPEYQHDEAEYGHFGSDLVEGMRSIMMRMEDTSPFMLTDFVTWCLILFCNCNAVHAAVDGCAQKEAPWAVSRLLRRARTELPASHALKFLKWAYISNDNGLYNVLKLFSSGERASVRDGFVRAIMELTALDPEQESHRDIIPDVTDMLMECARYAINKHMGASTIRMLFGKAEQLGALSEYAEIACAESVDKLVDSARRVKRDTSAEVLALVQEFADRHGDNLEKC